VEELEDGCFGLLSNLVVVGGLERFDDELLYVHHDSLYKHQTNR